MRTKMLNNAKLIVKVESDKNTKQISTVWVFDNVNGEYWDNDRIKERGIEWFLNIDDLKESLNWNLNGDEAKYQFKWGQSSQSTSEGTAYIFD